VQDLHDRQGSTGPAPRPRTAAGIPPAARLVPGLPGRECSGAAVIAEQVPAGHPGPRVASCPPSGKATLAHTDPLPKDIPDPGPERSQGARPGQATGGTTNVTRTTDTPVRMSAKLDPRAALGWRQAPPTVKSPVLFIEPLPCPERNRHGESNE
jgi:hypothetical protein